MPKTITTYLLSDNPSGIKKVWVNKNVCQCVQFTKEDLLLAKKRNELNQPSLYLMFNGKEAYIGEAENFNDRINNHQYKDFWQNILVFTANDKSLSKSDVKYLEALAVKRAQQVNQYTIKNSTTPNFPQLQEHLANDAEKFFTEIEFLCSFLNFDIFKQNNKIERIETNNAVKQKNDNIIEPITNIPSNQEYWYCKNKNKGVDAKAIYDEKEKTMTILASSKIAKTGVPSLRKGVKADRQQAIKTATQHEKYFILTENKIFGSPSGASDFCIGNSKNGWLIWKNKDGKTLDEVYRQAK